jgi:hypothetical protein
MPAQGGDDTGVYPGTNIPIVPGVPAPPTAGNPAAGKTPGQTFIDPGFYRVPTFPYASLGAQLQDALNLSKNGAGVYANQMTGKLQNIANAQPYVGGGLLGASAYSGGPNPFLANFNPFAGRGNQYPGAGGPPGGGTPVTPGGPGGGPVPPSGYAPGDPMNRPNPYNPGPAPGPGSTRPPGAAPLPYSRANPGGGLLQPAGGAPAARSTPAGGLLPTPQPFVSPPQGGVFDPGKGDTSAASMVAYFNSLPTDAAKANYVKAIDQYGAGKGGAANLGAGLQSALRASMGQSQFDNWSATNIGAKGSMITADGLPAWLKTALGG